MASMVRRSPVSSTNIAELITADAGYMIAAIKFINHHLAARTLTKMKDFLEYLQSNCIALTFVVDKQALDAVL
jgi:hypothetical protein